MKFGRALRLCNLRISSAPVPWFLRPHAGPVLLHVARVRDPERGAETTGTMIWNRHEFTRCFMAYDLQLRTEGLSICGDRPSTLVSESQIPLSDNVDVPSGMSETMAGTGSRSQSFLLRAQRRPHHLADRRADRLGQLGPRLDDGRQGRVDRTILCGIGCAREPSSVVSGLFSRYDGQRATDNGHRASGKDIVEDLLNRSHHAPRDASQIVTSSACKPPVPS